MILASTLFILPVAIKALSFNNQLSEKNGIYSIVDVSPRAIENNEIFTVTFQSLDPQPLDFIAAFTPPDNEDADSYPSTDYLSQTSPVKFGNCTEDGGYLSTGEGVLLFQMTNLRSHVRFYYFSGGVFNATLVAESGYDVGFVHENEPLRNRLVPTGDPNTMDLLWSSKWSETPTLQWGTLPRVYTISAAAKTRVIDRSELCGAPANETGWRDLGSIHTATFVGILDQSLSSKRIYYRFGDAATDVWSRESIFLVPPAAGSNPPGRPTRVALLADAGRGTINDNTYTWNETGTISVNTSNSILKLVQEGEIDAVYHSGDLSYANGYLSAWDFFMNMISPVSGSVLYLNTVGNHETDWPGTHTIPYIISNGDSGGECGVVSTALMPMPHPATIDAPWWSYDIGLIHFIGMSSEHNFSVGSLQHRWIARDLAKVDRSKTPWIIFSGHRPMYVNSYDCCVAQGTNPDYLNSCSASKSSSSAYSCYLGSDVETMAQLQESIEPLLYHFGVQLMFAGHYHNAQRQSAVYQNKVVQASVDETDEDGEEWAVHKNPGATVHLVLGNAGQTYANKSQVPPPSWNELTMLKHGYAVASAASATHLYLEVFPSKTDEGNKVLDRLAIIQEPPKKRFGIQRDPKQAPSFVREAVSGISHGFLFLDDDYYVLSNDDDNVNDQDDDAVSGPGMKSSLRPHNSGSKSESSDTAYFSLSWPIALYTVALVCLSLALFSYCCFPKGRRAFQGYVQIIDLSRTQDLALGSSTPVSQYRNVEKDPTIRYYQT